MSFIYPLAFIGLIAVPAVIFLYLFRNKYKEKVIPSLMLVEQVSRMTDSARPWQKLRRNLLLLLQLICVFLLVLSMAAPVITGEALAKSTIIIIDASMSMSATDVAPSRLDGAKAAAKALISAMKAGDSISVIALTDKPYLAVASSGDAQALTRAVDIVAQTNAEADIEAAASIARSLLQLSPDSELVLFTDGQREVSAEARVGLFGESIENSAITLLSAAESGSALVCVAKVKNFGLDAVSKSLSLFSDQRLVGSEEFTLLPGEERSFYFGLDAGGELSARLEPPDMLRADDTAYAVVSGENERRVIYYSRQNSFLHNALAIVPGISLYRGDMASLAASSGYSLYIYDGTLPAELPGDGHILLINPPEGNALVETSGDAEPGKPAVYSHPLTKYLESCEFSVLSAKKTIPPENAEIAIGGAVPLLYEYRLDKQLVVVLSFDLHNSDLPLKPEFPVLIYNIVERLIPSRTGGETGIYCGERVELAISPDSASVVMYSPGGEKTTLAPPFPVPVFSATGEPGIYRLVQERTGNETKLSAFAVNTPVSESDLSREAKPGDGEAGGLRLAPGAISLAPYLIAALLLLSLIEWRVYSRAG